MTIDHDVYRAGLSGEELVSELRALLAVERDAIRLTCRYVADLADCIEARSCWALGAYRDVYHAAQCLLGIGVHSTRERVRVGRAVRELPRIDQALVTGELSYSRVREVTRVAQPEDEGQWLALARALPMRQLEQRVAGACAAGACPEMGASGAAKTDEPARLRWTTPAVVEVAFHLPAEVWALLRRAMEGARRASESSLGDAEAMAAVARDALSAQESEGSEAGDLRKAVVLYECQTCSRAEVDTGAGAVELGPVAAASLGCGAKVRDLRTEGRLVRRGGPLPKSVERAVRLRDRNGCRVPGWNRRRYVEVHHIHEQSRGGEHSRRNCACLCSSHHTLLHEGRLRIEGDADGELVVRDETGARITSQGGIAPGQAWKGGNHVDDGRNPRKPAGVSPARQRLATSRKRVLRGLGATRAAKRRQRVLRPREFSLEIGICHWSPRRSHRGGSTEAPSWRGVEVRSGSRNAA